MCCWNGESEARPCEFELQEFCFSQPFRSDHAGEKEGAQAARTSA
jgi:hypothetical protein